MKARDIRDDANYESVIYWRSETSETRVQLEHTKEQLKKLEVVNGLMKQTLVDTVNKLAEKIKQIKELEESKLALEIAFNGKLATEKTAYESRIRELQSQALK
jgi:hypothetical protein